MLRKRKSGPRFLSLIILALLGFVSIIGTDGGDGDGGTPAPSPPPPTEPAPPAPQPPPGTPPAAPTNPTQFGTPQEDVAVGVATDPAGNVIVAGYSAGSLHENQNLGGRDAILIKYRPDGSREWTRQFGTTARDEASAVATDSAGNIYVVGATLGGTVPGVASAGFAKFDPSGNLVWEFDSGIPEEDFATAVAVDGSGNLYVVVTVRGPNGSDLLLVKLDTNGSGLWADLISTPLEDWGAGVAVDSAGNAYVAGTTEGDLGQPNEGGQRDFLLVKYDAGGNRVWLRQTGTGEIETWNSVAIDNAGGVYVAGYSSSEAASGADVSVAKFDANGSEIWSTRQGDVGYDAATGIAADPTGIYVTGTLGVNAFLARFNPAGPLEWVSVPAGIPSVTPHGLTARGGDIYVVGETSGALPGNVHAGGVDGFVARFGPDGNLR